MITLEEAKTILEDDYEQWSVEDLIEEIFTLLKDDGICQMAIHIQKMNEEL